jgi:long-chain acyl-CoA synthetase
MKLRWESFAEFLADRAAAGGERPAFSLWEEGWRHLSFREVRESAEARARALLRSGHRAGDRVAILSPTKLALTPEILGIMLAGAVAVPLDPKLSSAELLAILRHVEPRTLIVAEELRALGADLAAEAGIAKLLFLAEVPALPFSEASPPALPAPSLDDTVAIYYTSGTVGRAKGVMVSARSILTELTALSGFEENDEDDVIFSILPLNHLYGFTAGVLYSLACGSEYVFAHSLKPDDITRCLVERRVTQLNVVPLLLNLMRRGIQARIAGQPAGKRRLVEICLKIGPFLPVALRRAIFKSIHEKMGGRLRGAVCGAAPLDPATFQFFNAIGAPIYEGYGLTETGPVVSVNHPGRAKKGSAGQPLPGVEVKIENPGDDGSGEILTRGPHLMRGYFRDDPLTREAINEEGWFRTGDLGRLDRGYLRITGRLKGLIVLPSGKKVHAEEVEQALSMSRHLQDVCVVGIPTRDHGEMLAAVVFPTEGFGTGEERQKAVEREVFQACRGLAAWKQPQRVIVRDTPFAKTSSGKVKRHLVMSEVRSL